MCIQLKNYFTNKYRFSHLHDALIMAHPCGRCDECLDEVQTEWAMRAAAEYRNTKRQGGYVVMATLTYRENALNRFPVTNQPCFNRRDVQNFLKILRNAYAPGSVRYIVCSEYGELRKRPHLHINLHFNDPVSWDAPLKVQRVSKHTRYTKYHTDINGNPIYDEVKGLQKCLALIDYAWKHGHVGYSEEFGPLVQGIEGCKYTCKYVTKDITCPDNNYILNIALKIWQDFCDTGDITEILNLHPECTTKRTNGPLKGSLTARAARLYNRLLQDINNCIGILPSNDSNNSDTYYPFDPDCDVFRRMLVLPLKRMLPFHLQSVGFGKCMLDESDIKDSILKNGTIPFDTHNTTISKIAPRYIQRKVFYDLLEDKTYRLNETGIDFRLQHFDENAAKTVARWKSYLNAKSFIDRASRNWAGNTKLQECVDEINMYLENADILHYDKLHVVSRSTKKPTLYDIYYYYKLYKGYCFVPDAVDCGLSKMYNKSIFTAFPNASAAFYRYQDILRKQVYLHDEIIENPRMQCISDKPLDTYLFNNLTKYKNFDAYVETLLFLDHAASRIRFEERLRKRQTKQIHKHD